MNTRYQNVLFMGVALLIAWLFYVERTILTPFVLAAIFAYIFNPLVNFFSHKVRLPRTVSIIFIYFIIVGIITGFGITVVRRVTVESFDFSNTIGSIVDQARTDINSLPELLQPYAQDALLSVEKSKLFSIGSIFTVFPEAISRIVSFFIFLFSGFYFLKEGKNMIHKLISFIPSKYRDDTSMLIGEVNKVFGGYLRGQIFLVLMVALGLYIFYTILGIKFALILALFTGFAEIIPIIGPITATTVAVIAVITGGASNFNLTIPQAIVIVIVFNFAFRQLQDYFITPYVLGRVTKLHPLVVLFAVLAGGHTMGLLGLLLGVPIAAAFRIILEHLFNKTSSEEKSHKKP